MAELHFEKSNLPPGPRGSWRKELTRYHWFVLIVAALGWVFDCLDQQLFILARKPAMESLLNTVSSDPRVDQYSTYATSIFLLGWALGGLIFGVLGDRIGRAKTMMWTILIYSVFTGLSALSVGWIDFAFYRFLTGMGVGGEFAVGVALVAETMPERARPYALGLLQALSTVGNISAAFISIWLGELEQTGVLGQFNLFGVKLTAWRAMFMIGTLPALLAIVIRLRLKEPEKWQHAVAEGGKQVKAGSLAELFGDPRWRHRAIVGLLLASAGVIGLWGIGFFSPDVNRGIFRVTFEKPFVEKGGADLDQQFLREAISDTAKLDSVAKKVTFSMLLSTGGASPDTQLLYKTALDLHKKEKPVNAQSILAAIDSESAAKGKPVMTSDVRAERMKILEGSASSGAVDLAELASSIVERSKEIEGELTLWTGITQLMFNVGAFFGIYTFSHVTARLGRKKTFAIAFVAAMVSTAWVFLSINRLSDVFWMTPIMGFCQISLFGGYAIYFPELFPTRLRSTGTSFCYNVGRVVAAVGTGLRAPILGLFAAYGADAPRYAAVAMCSVFLVGLFVLPFAPETKGKPLPE